MKKSLIALAVLASVAGAVQAQSSSVTVYGVADVIVNKISGGNTLTNTTTTLDSSGNYNQSGSRIGFKGSEDIGGGLKANFQLESGILMDTGASAQSGLAFGRQAWVGLEGNFGGIKLGRQNSAHYKAALNVDPFEDGYAGAITQTLKTGAANPATAHTSAFDVRVDNTLSYSTPSINGFNAEVQYSFGEDATDSKKSRNIGAGASYVNGPAAVRLGYEEKINSAATTTEKRTFIGGTWNFGVAKAAAGYNLQTVKVDATGVKNTDKASWLIGVSAPVGPGTLLASYTVGNDKTSADIDRTVLAVGYNYSLSKRTSLYASYASYKEDTKTSSNVSNVGVRHSF